MLKRGVLFLLALAMLLALVGCGQTKAELVVSLPESMADWQQEYAVKTFETEYHCSIVFAQEGQAADVFLLADGEAKTKAAAGELLAMGEAQVPNWKRLQENLLLPEFKTEGGYAALPFVYEPYALAYAGKHYQTVQSQWGALWEKENKKHIVVPDDGELLAWLAAANLSPKAPEEARESELQESFNTLVGQISSYWQDAKTFATLYETEQVFLAVLPTRVLSQLWDQGVKLSCQYPETGVFADGYYWAISAETGQKSLACAWVNWLLSDDFQQHYAMQAGAPCLPANRFAAENLSHAQKNRLHLLAGAPETVVLRSSISENVKTKWQSLWAAAKQSARENQGE